MEPIFAYLYTGRNTGWQTIAFTRVEERDSFVVDMDGNGWSVTAELPAIIQRTKVDALGATYYPEA